MQQIVNCPNCGSQINEGQQFCGACGASIFKDTLSSASTCRGCGTAINPEQRYCGVCGTQLSTDNQVTLKLPQASEVITPEKKANKPEKPLVNGVDSSRITGNPSTNGNSSFGLLKFTAATFQVLGWILLVGGCLASIAMIVFAIIGGGFQLLIPGLDTLSGAMAIGLGAGCLILSFIYGLGFIAFADLCRTVANIALNISAKRQI